MHVDVHTVSYTAATTLGDRTQWRFHKTVLDLVSRLVTGGIKAGTAKVSLTRCMIGCSRCTDENSSAILNVSTVLDTGCKRIADSAEAKGPVLQG